MKEIKLTQGKVALVNDDVYKRASKFKWYAHKLSGIFYAVRKVRNVKTGKQRDVFLHREIMGAGRREEVHHVDGNGLNNVRENLMVGTHQQNIMGYQRPKTGASSRFRGVCWHKEAQKMQAQITRDGKTRYLGLFSTEEAAARAYNTAATKLFGRFAALNVV